MSEILPGAPAARTPGDVFRATLHERWAARGRCIDTRPYSELPREDRDDLEAATAAAITHVAGLPAGDCDRAAEIIKLRAVNILLNEALDLAEKQDDAWTAAVDEILRHSGERSNLTDEGRRQAAVGYVRNLEAACKAAGLTVEGPGL